MLVRTLGGVDLRSDDGRRFDTLLSRPKELTLLVYLAYGASGGGCTTRDVLLSLFWPELDDGRARHALRQMIYSLRRQLGHGLVRCQNNREVGTHPNRLRCDANQLRAAAAAGRWEMAVTLYGGEFLAGFNPGQVSAELEHWIDGVRAQLRDTAVEAARWLSETAEAKGDMQPAIRWSRRAVEIAPHSERDMHRLIRLLGRIESVPEAVDAYRRYRQRLETDLDMLPGEALRQAVEGLLNRRRLWTKAKRHWTRSILDQ